MTAFPELYRREEARAFVAGIHSHPDDDTIRLALADWIEERAGEDAVYRDSYLARAEFIRAGCAQAGKSLARQNRREAAWLDENWTRLFPTLMALHGYHNAEPVTPPLLWRRGRAFRFSVCYRVPYQHPRDYAGYFTVELRRGFIDHIDWHGNLPYWARLLPALAKDDPVVDCFPSSKIIRPVIQDVELLREVRADDVGEGVFSRLRPSRYRVAADGRAVAAIYFHDDDDEQIRMALRDVCRAAREWSEDAPVGVSMTDAEFYGVPEMPVAG